MIFRFVRPSEVNSWLSVNAPTSAAQGTPGDAWRHYLAANSGTGRTEHDLESSYLKTAGATGNTLSELWSSYLISLNYTTGTLQERFRAFVRDTQGIAERYLRQNGTDSYTLQDGSGVYILQ